MTSKTEVTAGLTWAFLMAGNGGSSNPTKFESTAAHWPSEIVSGNVKEGTKKARQTADLNEWVVVEGFKFSPQEKKPIFVTLEGENDLIEEIDMCDDEATISEDCTEDPVDLWLQKLRKKIGKDWTLEKILQNYEMNLRDKNSRKYYFSRSENADSKLPKTITMELQEGTGSISFIFEDSTSLETGVCEKTVADAIKRGRSAIERGTEILQFVDGHFGKC
eukprot:GHVP01069066.1.p1 GENE.GHVP01069066.1~~GHVP01069066.1.p1  ORF type:complete len:238 (+),score=43.56 GHVP01069066.1:57-716(+)